MNSDLLVMPSQMELIAKIRQGETSKDIYDDSNEVPAELISSRGSDKNHSSSKGKP